MPADSPNDKAVAVVGQAPPPFAASVLSAQDRLKQWFTTLSPNTRRAYERDLTNLARHLGLETAGAGIAALCEFDRKTALAAVESFRAHLVTRGLSPSAVNRPLSSINSALRHLARAEYGPGPLDVDGIKPELVKDTRGPDSEHLRMVMRRLRKSDEPRSMRDYAIVLLAGERALRRSELVAIHLSDIDLDKRELRVHRKGKRQKSVIVISETTCKALARWLDARIKLARCDALFVTITSRPDQSGQPLSADAVFRMIKQLGANAAAWRPHGLRHTAITTTLRRTNNIEAARVLAGHATIATTQRYLDDKAGMERMAVAAMDGAYDDE